MYIKWALIGLLVSQAIASTPEPGSDQLVADVEEPLNLAPTPTIPSNGPASDASLIARRAGGGHKNANKVAVNTSGGPYPKGRWTSHKVCIKKTGSAGNVYATLCANPGESPTNIHPAPKTTAKPAPKPKSTSKKCQMVTQANGLQYTCKKHQTR